MRIEIRADSVLIEGYVNAVARDSRVLQDDTTRFVEQIVPGAFARALMKNDVDILLNHNDARNLGSTRTNLALAEDSIGLKARVIVTDPEVMQKARDRKLRGWSFGFFPLDYDEEDAGADLKRRYVKDLDLREVSLIDDQMIPAYAGTSIEARATGGEAAHGDTMLARAEYVETVDTIDLTEYKNRIKNLEREKNNV